MAYWKKDEGVHSILEGERELRKIVLLKIQYGSGKIRDKRRNIGKLTKFELDFYTFNKEEKIICSV